jgi:3-oxoacyl-[acyl-carrier protein] reductase
LVENGGELIMGKLTGKVAIVTGASKGIGAGIAKGLAAAGASVVVNYSSSKPGADRVVDEIQSQGGKAIAIQGDVSKSADIRRLFEQTRKAFGSLDVLVNNAGVFKFTPLEDVTEEEFHREFNTNVLGTILAIQEAVKYFGTHGGSIINLSSVVATNPPPGSVVYSPTKSAIDSITRVLAKELGPRKIRINSIAPGLTETEGATATDFFASPAANLVVANTPLGRVGVPDDIAPAAVFLASDDSAWLTGESIRVSGGLQ